jgi:hypothetical protein
MFRKKPRAFLGFCEILENVLKWYYFVKQKAQKDIGPAFEDSAKCLRIYQK